MNKKLIALVLLAVIAVPSVAFARDIKDMVDVAADILTKIAGALCVLMIVWAGILFLMASGEPDKVTKAKQALLYAIIGAVVALGAAGFKAIVDAITI